ncbi:hypothetical protein PVAP13_8KG155704 [Panicum virgatum]|uniref:Uncharacterized protein n=1 Tax=Panicum virgatum TaxID=38727 RepID=A0A8T0PM79_PANVG|nr:hypothetical protein PVAP13_8KG155704 [Panicum virgatum]
MELASTYAPGGGAGVLAPGKARVRAPTGGPSSAPPGPAASPAPSPSPVGARSRHVPAVGTLTLPRCWLSRKYVVFIIKSGGCLDEVIINLSYVRFSEVVRYSSY